MCSKAQNQEKGSFAQGRCEHALHLPLLQNPTLMIVSPVVRLPPFVARLRPRLVEAQQTAAILSTFNEVDLSAVMALRKSHQDAFVKANEVKLGFMSFFVKAVVHALKAVPGLNVRIEGDQLVEHHYYDIGVAVGTERGLVVPVLRDCDQMTFAEIEQGIVGLCRKSQIWSHYPSGHAGGMFYHHQWRHLRILVIHANHQSSSKRHFGYAHHSGASGCP